MSYTAGEASIEIVGITELVKCADSLVPATIVTMLLCLAHSIISRITFGQNWQAKRLVTLLLHMRKPDSHGLDACCCIVLSSATNGTMSNLSIRLLSFLVLFSRLFLRGFVIIFSN